MINVFIFLSYFKIYIGESKKLKIKLFFKIFINGTNNYVDGLDENCLVEKILISGIENEVKLNQKCWNVYKTITGIENKLIIEAIKLSPNSGNNTYNAKT